MAGVNSKSQTEMFDVQMTCCLGNHPLCNPKLLPCQHSFCSECIKAKVNQDRKEFMCPKCQLSLPLTEKEVDQLQDDVLFQIVQDSKDRYNCVICKFDDKKNQGTFQCLDCGDVLCDECKVGHTKTSLTRLHTLVSLKDIQDGKRKGAAVDASRHLCQTHSKPKSSMFRELYCEDCKCLACQICVYEEHKPKGHTCKNIDDIHDEKTNVVTDQVTKLFELKQLDEDFAAVLEQGQGHNNELQQKLENDVHQRAALFMDIIEKVKQDKLEEIKGHFKKENSLIEEELNETRNGMIRTDSIVSYTQAFLQHSDKAEFVQHEHNIMKKIKNQMKEKMARTLKINVLDIGEPQIEKTEAFIAEAFGKVTINTKTLSKNREEKAVPKKWMKEPKVLFSVDSGIGGINDLTVTENGEIAAVSGSTIQVYNSEGKQKEKINCSQLESGWNVVAKGDTLYVSNHGANGNVLVMNFKGNVKKTITLPETSQGHSFKGLAVDDEGNVYISSCGTNAIYKCEVNDKQAQIFIPQGTRPDLKGPVYLDMTSTGNLVVSNHSSNTILVFDRYGEFLWQYNGQGEMALTFPHGVSSDGNGNIYISDHYNDRVVVVNDGELQGCVKLQALTNLVGITVDNEDNIVCSFGPKFAKIKVWE